MYHFTHTHVTQKGNTAVIILNKIILVWGREEILNKTPYFTALCRNTCTVVAVRNKMSIKPKSRIYKHSIYIKNNSILLFSNNNNKFERKKEKLQQKNPPK